MATLDALLEILNDLLERVRNIEERLNTGQGVVTTEGVSDIDDNLGLMKAGEIRFGRGVPGKGFSGIRIKHDGLTYGSTDYYVVSVSSDALVWGIRTDGTEDTG